MRTIACACLLAMPALAAAESPPPEPAQVAHEPRLSLGLAGAVTIERNLAVMTNLELGWRLRPDYWVEAAFGIGHASLLDPGGSGQDGSRAFEGRAGVARLGCGRAACAGLAGSVGFHHQSLAFTDSLVDPEMWTETRDLVFGEIRGLGRLRVLSGRVALEAALAARVYGAVRAEHADGGTNAGVVASLGLHATL